MSINGAPTSVNDTPTFPVSFDFDIGVDGFDETDVDVGYGTISNFQKVSAVKYTANITPDGSGDVTIDIDAGGAGNSTDPAVTNSQAATVTVRVVHGADLSVKISADPDPALAGGVLTYTIKVSNAGPQVAEVPEATVTLPPVSPAIALDRVQKRRSEL